MLRPASTADNARSRAFHGAHLVLPVTFAIDSVLRERQRHNRDRMLIFGRRHLEAVVAEYADHYNSHRPHRSLEQTPPFGPAQQPIALAGRRMLRRDRLGGLVGEYSQAA
jgi:transposase InsO family protein